LANGDLADCSFRREFAPILMPSKNPASLTHELSGFTRRIEIVNVIGVSSPKPLGQQEIDGLS
jgi:hypothetical protein